MRILWFHWKDIKNPKAGGAEVLSHEVSKRLVMKGHTVTQFCAKFPSCKNEEVIDGISLVRDGGRYSVYMKAKTYYKKNKDNFDLIIDEINTRPFMTPTFVDKPIVVLIHQLAREFWFYETRFPLNVIGYYVLENFWLRKYRKILTITVSQSTKDDLTKLNFENVKIIPVGLSVEPLAKVPSKDENPTIIFVGRLKKAKLPDIAIKSFLEIKKKINDAQLWIIGEGEMRNKLEDLSKGSDSIKFWGRIPENKKYHLMSRASIILMPAVREGWGLVVTEANAMGTPAVAYNVQGLKDSVQNNVNGFLSDQNNVFSLAEKATKLLKNKELLHELSEKSLSFAKQFNWDKTADVFEHYLNDGK